VGTVRWILALILVWLGGLGVTGCVLAFLFELQGFGTPRDTGARPLLLIGYVALATCCAMGAAGAWWWLLPMARSWAVPAVVASVAVSAVMLGSLGL
jgi:K+ transporter